MFFGTLHLKTEEPILITGDLFFSTTKKREIRRSHLTPPCEATTVKDDCATSFPSGFAGRMVLPYYRAAGRI